MTSKNVKSELKSVYKSRQIRYKKRAKTRQKWAVLRLKKHLLTLS